jgi:hypothetical protein
MARVQAVFEQDFFSVDGALAAVVPMVSPVGLELRATLSGFPPTEQSSSATVPSPLDLDLLQGAGNLFAFLNFLLALSWDEGHDLLPEEDAPFGTGQLSAPLVATEQDRPGKRGQATSEDEDAAEVPALTLESSNHAEYEEIPFDLNQVLPKASGPLANFLPFDPEVLDLAVQQVVQQIDELGEDLTSLLHGMGLSPWLMAAATAAAAYEIARRQLQWSQLRQAYSSDGQGSGTVWLPDVADPSSGERS